ncbi:S41 family peptidase [Roseimicrobium sp. ORNL1]|uniref:S41 family peptidase n=1 Tax=Roseimicrobium sp. ORNL1 TaxID=2711231 RepID=UPI0013E15451|nr:S41 family peptidase [Roseimicrobium sp. ORNL1]QIF00367.1 S41 family peptidase [Roseimicrobium sp. ORNL1]
MTPAPLRLAFLLTFSSGLASVGLLPAPLTAQEPPPAAAAKPADDPAYAQLELLTRAMEIIRQNYVNEKEVSYEKLVEGALEGMLRKLDPHCEYMGRSLFEEMQQEQRDTSEGVGITIALREGTLTIITVQENGPAAKAGVQPNDQIIRIGEVLTDSMSTMEAVQHLKGKAGEAIRITVRRPGTKQFLDFNLVRQALHESSVRDAMLLHDRLASPWKIGYARITEFTQNTPKDLSNELDKLEKEGMQAFILDLRNNPGGLIDSAVGVCGEFLPPNTVVVTTEGRVASQNPPPYRTPPREGKALRKYPMAILINQGSASGSELVAGALQDLKRAIIVGTTSFGKGSVQTILPMKNGAAMRLTTAKYYTPAHRTIHENGVEPNIVSSLTSEEEGKIMQWRADTSSGEARGLDLAKLGDRQLERATDVLKGVLVYQQFEKGAAPAAAATTTPTPPAPGKPGEPKPATPKAAPAPKPKPVTVPDKIPPPAATPAPTPGLSSPAPAAAPTPAPAPSSAPSPTATPPKDEKKPTPPPTEG